jgi:hypothetical protein
MAHSIDSQACRPKNRLTFFHSAPQTRPRMTALEARSSVDAESEGPEGLASRRLMSSSNQ